MHNSEDIHVWVEERVGDISAQKFRVSETLYSGHSEFQKVDVLKTEGYGIMLFLDGLVMLSERDEFIYHDMISHVPLYVHPRPHRVLIIGGGDGGTAREVLRHEDVKHCRMVEIDGMVVDVSKRFLRQTARGFDHPGLQLTIGDGVKFMAETRQRYDVVIIDSTDPIGPAKPLFGEAFYTDVFRVLADDGLVVAQGESTHYELEAQKTILNSVGKVFPRVQLYNYYNLTYPGGCWSFVFASKGLCPLADLDSTRIARQNLEFSYYNEAVHRAAFALPSFQRKRLGDLLRHGAPHNIT